MNTSILFVTNAFISNHDGAVLHPDLLLWNKQLSSRKQQWFQCSDNNPLGWYAALQSVSASALLASRCSDFPDETKQCWAASPYHAQLGRDTVRLMAEGLLPWMEQDAQWLCASLNPLLLQEDMMLHSTGSALVLGCCESMHAEPARFAEVSGRQLPNRHPKGSDAGRFIRLLSEIQMFLHQHPAEHRRQRGEPDVNGLWLWDAAEWPQSVNEKQIAVATRNPPLQSLVDGCDAKLIISEAERLAELLHRQAPLPKQIILAGEGHAVLLTKSLFAKFTKTEWVPKLPGDESELLSVLRSAV